MKIRQVAGDEFTHLTHPTYFQEINMSQPITLTPIGFVKSKFDNNTSPEEMRRELSQLVLEPELEPGLLGLEPGRDILVLFYLHRVEPAEVRLQLHPRHNPENPLAGVFATRTQFRPNPVAVTVARVEQVAGNVLTVSGLDAQDGTPVLDIKPYHAWFDAASNCQQLEVRQADSLQACREAIDGLDTEIIRLLGNRAKYVHQVAHFKQRVEDVRAPQRYEAVMRQRRELAEAAGLNPDVIEGMYKLLVDNFIKEEIELIKGRENKA
jgi:tRNA-Thr(GGU) m(6)t(6)A37 methyltransferase TsaA